MRLLHLYFYIRCHVTASLAFTFISVMTTPKAPVTPMENIREPQPLKDSIAFVYDTDVHQLASFIRSGPPLGRTKLMLALGLSFQAPGTRISGPPAPEGSFRLRRKKRGKRWRRRWRRTHPPFQRTPTSPTSPFPRPRLRRMRPLRMLALPFRSTRHRLPRLIRPFLRPRQLHCLQ